MCKAKTNKKFSSTISRNWPNHAILETRKFSKPGQSKKNNTNNITSLEVGASVTINQDEIIKGFENQST